MPSRRIELALGDVTRYARSAAPPIGTTLITARITTCLLTRLSAASSVIPKSAISRYCGTGGSDLDSSGVEARPSSGRHGGRAEENGCALVRQARRDDPDRAGARVNRVVDVVVVGDRQTDRRRLKSGGSQCYHARASNSREIGRESPRHRW